MLARILVVGNELITRADVEECLQEWGYRVAAVIPGDPDAISQALAEGVDLVLIDTIPNGSGPAMGMAWEVLRRFDIPMVCLTEQTSPERREKSLPGPKIQWVRKPFLEAELREAIRRALPTGGGEPPAL
jgi:CheY-like chemotaxis protein